MINKIKEIQLASKYIQNYLLTLNKNYFKSISSLLLIYLTSIYFNLILYNFNSFLLTSLYWFGLGILSTIGLGFGFHTGVFFLFPYITYTYDNELINNSQYPIYYTLVKCLFNIILWGIGSAIGELPPYIISYNSDEKLLDNNKYINFIKKYIDITNKRIQFLLILIMSSWPNITFDMCGMVCGYNKLSLKEFIIPTILGKGFIKAPIQSITILYLYKNGQNYNIFKLTPSYLSIIFNGCFILLLIYLINKVIIKLSKLN